MTSNYHQRAADEIRNEHPVVTSTPIMRKLVSDTRAMLLRGPADSKARASAARQYAIDHLDELHEQVRTNFERRGIGYHLANTPEEAIATMLRLLGDAKRVAKSKSMVGEEVGLTHAMRAAGIDVLETDIGEYIVDIEGRGPSHITAPALHLNRSRIRDMLARTGADLPDDDPVRLSQYVRDVVGDYFRDCDAGITGANAVIASSGRIVSVENEGNVSLGLSHPELHIIITGYEKVVADEAGALAILEVLAPSATAQPLTSFTNVMADPVPGQQRHVVFVENGRRRILEDERYREIMKCIRCGACMNACPVYRAAGGLSYGSPYMGPIGAVLSPLLWQDGRYADLPFASSLCGHCSEACPVGIPIHRMLLDLRADAVEAKQAGSLKEKAGWRTWAAAFSGERRGKLASKIGNVGLRTAGKLAAKQTLGDDPRGVPPASPTHTREKLTEAMPNTPVVVVPPDEILPESLVDIFCLRAAQLGVTVVESSDPVAGERRIPASAAIASTGSLLLTGDDATARRPLLGATRVVVELDASTIVAVPSDLADRLGDGNALILTGASRTADIEKQIVRGIHGAEELVVVLRR